MKVRNKIALVGASAALGLTPAIAIAAGPPNHPSGPPATVTTGPPAGVTTGPSSSVPPANQGTAHKPTTPGSQRTTPTGPGPSASLPAKAKAYGRYCQGESKEHVSGQKGTPFSQCVTAMAKVATANAKSPQAACSTESKKHVTGQKGTPFSLCVSGAAKLLKTEHTGTGDSTDA